MIETFWKLHSNQRFNVYLQNICHVHKKDLHNNCFHDSNGDSRQYLNKGDSRHF